MALRIDSGSLRPPRFTPDGRAVVDGALTRTGVFVYRNADGTERREYRPAAEVFKADSLTSFVGVPVTDDHPPELIGADNATQYARGAIVEAPRQDGNYVVASLAVWDAGVIAKMKSGKVQLSCGYDVDLVEAPGVSPAGERYDAVQTNIRGNHVAIVDSARAGSAARVRMDALAARVDASVMIDTRTDVRCDECSARNGDDATKCKACGAALPRKDAADTAEEPRMTPEQIAELKARADAAEAKVKETEAECAKQRARADAAEVALASEKTARTDAEAQVAPRVAARVALLAAAGPILGADAKVADLSDKAIKIAVVKKVDGSDIAADAHDEYVQGRYDAAVARGEASVDALANMRAAVLGGRTDQAGDAEAQAAARARAKLASNWKDKE